MVLQTQRDKSVEEIASAIEVAARGQLPNDQLQLQHAAHIVRMEKYTAENLRSRSSLIRTINSTETAKTIENFEKLRPSAEEIINKVLWPGQSSNLIFAPQVGLFVWLMRTPQLTAHIWSFVACGCVALRGCHHFRSSIAGCVSCVVCISSLMLVSLQRHKKETDREMPKE